MATQGTMYTPQHVVPTLNGNGNVAGQPQNGGIPQSQSFQGIPSLPISQGTPKGEGSDGDAGQVFSPSSSQAGHFTEPRNYAPRTSGQPATQEPPPKFNLGMVPYNASAQGEPQDVFYHGNGMNSAVASLVISSPISSSSIPAGPPAHRSDKLQALLDTPAGVPSYSTAMHPENFPFVESCRSGKAINYGVVKIGNVSVHCPLHGTISTF